MLTPVKCGSKYFPCTQMFSTIVPDALTAQPYSPYAYTSDRFALTRPTRMLALAIFIATLVLVSWGPKGLGIGWAPLIGAGAAFLSGVFGWSDVAEY